MHIRDCPRQSAAALSLRPESSSRHEEFKANPNTKWYNLWVWLMSQAPEDHIARRELDRITSDHPEWLPRERPDLSIFTGDWVERPIEATVHSALAIDPSPANVAQLLAQLPTDDWDHDETLRSVGTAQGLKWLEALSEVRHWRPETWSAILAGLRQGEASEVDLAYLSRVLEELPRLADVGYEVATLVERGLAAKQPEGIPAAEMDAARLLVRRLWRSIRRRQQSMPEPTEDALSVAINSEGGVIAQATLRLLSAEVTVGDRILAPFYKSQFEWALRTHGSTSESVSVVCASQLHFLAHLDLKWARETVLTTMAPDNRPRADHMWHGFLSWARLTDPLRDELWVLFESWWSHLDTFPERWRSRFAEYAAALVVTASSDERAPGFVRNLVQLASVDVRAAWADDVGRLLGDSTADTQLLVWRSWLRSYWHDRLSGIPRALDASEVGGMARWPLVLGDKFAEAVALLLQSQSGSTESGRVYADLSTSGWLDERPDDSLSFLLHLLESEDRHQFWHCSEATLILNRVRNQATPVVVRRVESRLAELGC